MPLSSFRAAPLPGTSGTCFLEGVAPWTASCFLGAFLSRSRDGPGSGQEDLAWTDTSGEHPQLG